MSASYIKEHFHARLKERSAFCVLRSAFCVLRSAFCVLRSAFCVAQPAKAGFALAPKLTPFLLIALVALASCGGSSPSDSSDDSLDPVTPTAADFTISGLEQVEGDVKAVTITPKDGKSAGEITVYYDGVETLPTAAGPYTITFDVAGGDDFTATQAPLAVEGRLHIIPEPLVTMTTAGEGAVSIDLTGAGDATIYWGDGSDPLTRTLAVSYSSYPHTYTAPGEKTIRIVSGGTLTELNCHGNQLTGLDVSKNTTLKYLYCFNNSLTALDVSKNTALEILWCHYNQLSGLDVSKNTALTDLSCYGNQLANLDVSKNTALTELYCQSNLLEKAALEDLFAGLVDRSASSTKGTVYCGGTNPGYGTGADKADPSIAEARGWTVEDTL